MADKTFVTLEQKVCVACHAVFDSGDLLLDKRVRPVFDKKTVTGYDWCPTHKAKKDEGYLFLIGIDATKSNQPYTPRTVYHTGGIAMIREDAWSKIFSEPMPPQVMEKRLCYVDNATLDYLQQAAAEAEARATSGSEGGA